jgi:hypothetical protein
MGKYGSFFVVGCVGFLFGGVNVFFSFVELFFFGLCAMM